MPQAVRKQKTALGSAQAFEKARFGQGNQSKSKGFFVANRVSPAPANAKIQFCPSGEGGVRIWTPTGIIR
jgi:hypothetical protein